MKRDDAAASDLRLCADGKVFHVHRDVLAMHSSYVREFIESPVKRQRTGHSMYSLNISLPELSIANDVISKNVTPLGAFEAFLSFCYQHGQQDRVRSDELFAVAVIADFMMSESILAKVDKLIACLPLINRQWDALFAFAKKFGLRRTRESLLGSQSADMFQSFTRSDDFFQLEQNEMLAILRNTNLPILLKVFAVFWHCTGLHDEDFVCRESFQTIGDAKSASLIRLIQEVVSQATDTTTLDFLLKSIDRFELLSDDGDALQTYMLYRAIAKRALTLRS